MPTLTEKPFRRMFKYFRNPYILYTFKLFCMYRKSDGVNAETKINTWHRFITTYHIYIIILLIYFR